MTVDGPPIIEWIGLPVQYNFTIYEHPFIEDYRKHAENASFHVGVSQNFSLPFIPYVVNLTKCNESTRVLLDEAFAQEVSVNASYHQLYPYTNYSVAVKACTAVGCGNFSKHFHFTTDEEVPTCAPRNISVLNSSSTSLEITWLPPLRKCENGVTVNYSIEVNDTWTSEKRVLFSSSQSIGVYGLKKFYVYCIRLAAATSKGFGNYSDPACNRTDQHGKFIGPL